DQALHREDGVFRVRHRLALGRLADKTLAIAGDGDDRGRGARAFRILDDLDVLAVHDGDAGVRCTEVDADYFSHFRLLSFKQTVRTHIGVPLTVPGHGIS